MSFTMKKQHSFQDGGGTTISGNLTTTVDDRRTIVKDVPDGSTDLLIDIPDIVQSTLKAFAMSANGTLTVKTNSSGAPQETFSLVANEPQTWISSEVAAKPIAGDVTALYVTNASGASITLTLIVGN